MYNVEVINRYLAKTISPFAFHWHKLVTFRPLWKAALLFFFLRAGLINKTVIYYLYPPPKGVFQGRALDCPMRHCSEVTHHLLLQQMSIALRAHSASPSDLSMGGVGVLWPWKKQATHRNDCVIIVVIQSGPHTHTRVESRSGVPDPSWPDWRRMRCWPVGTRWPSSSCRGPKSVRFPRQRLKKSERIPHAFIKVIKYAIS